MRSRVLFAALLTIALACFNAGVAKADATETAKAGIGQRVRRGESASSG